MQWDKLPPDTLKSGLCHLPTPNAGACDNFREPQRCKQQRNPPGTCRPLSPQAAGQEGDELLPTNLRLTYWQKAAGPGGSSDRSAGNKTYKGERGRAVSPPGREYLA